VAADDVAGVLLGVVGGARLRVRRLGDLASRLVVLEHLLRVRFGLIADVRVGYE
jgi:hypothetical protein